MKKVYLFFALSVCFLSLWGQTDLSRIDSLIGTLPNASEVGISVYDLTEQKQLYSYHEQKLSRPASTMKLLTAITLLSHSGAEEPFATEVWYDGVIRKDTLHGDVYIIGGFDPEFDDHSMNMLVEGMAAFPFKVLDGHLYGDVSAKDSLYWGNGWAWDDTPEAYQPYLSPLMFCKGAVRVKALPSSKRGKAARIICTPVSSYYTVINQTRTRTLSAGRFSVSRDWLVDGNNLLVKGNVENSRVGWVNIYSSRDFFMHVLVERLTAKGIKLPQTYDFKEFHPEATSMRMTRHECSVQKVLNQLMKESDNLNGEAMLWRLGAQATGKKRVSEKDGIVEIKKLISGLGHCPDDYRIADGCGLSNYNYISPALLVDFLKFAYSRKDIFDKLYPSLPVAGVDGTLKRRMKQSSGYRNVHAKTGSFTAINTLAGYLKTKNGHEIAFSIMNQNILSAAKARAFQDKVCEVIIDD